MIEAPAPRIAEPARLTAEHVSDAGIRTVDQVITGLNPNRRRLALSLTGLRRGVINTALAFGVLINSGCGNIPTPNIESPRIDLPSPPSIKPPEFDISFPWSTKAAEPIPAATATAQPTKEPTPTISPTPAPTRTPEATATPKATPKPEKKIPTELPKDIVSDEELLEKYHTRIWNTPDVKLHIRRAALENEPIFKRLLEGKNRVNNEEMTHNLDIVLVDGPSVHTIYLSEEQKKGLPDNVLRALRSDEIRRFQAFKQYARDTGPAAIKSLEQLIDGERKQLDAKKITDEEFKFATEDYSKLIYLYSGKATDEEIDDYLARNTAHAWGMYVSPKFNLKTYDVREPVEFTSSNSAIFLAVSRKEDKKVGRMTILSQSGKPPYPKDSYPDPREYRISSSDPTYPVPASTAGFALRHEFAHEVSSHPKTDYIALDGIKEAWEKFQKTGDDSGYYFVFETPKGIVVTEKQQALPSEKTA